MADVVDAVYISPQLENRIFVAPQLEGDARWVPDYLTITMLETVFHYKGDRYLAVFISKVKLDLPHCIPEMYALVPGKIVSREGDSLIKGSVQKTYVNYVPSAIQEDLSDHLRRRFCTSNFGKGFSLLDL